MRQPLEPARETRWPRLLGLVYAALRTSKAKWEPLTESGTWARHLSDRRLPKLETIDRAALLRLAHEAVELTLNEIGVGKSR